MKGSSWIFLRGLSREKDHWDDFPTQFENELGAKVHCLDLPGTGDFFHQISPNNISEIVDHLNMHSSHVVEQSWILAHSMGCLAAIEWMRREPHRFHGAVFINTSIRGISPTFRRLTKRAIFNFLRLLVFQRNPRRREELKYFITCNDPEKKESTILKWMEIQKKHPVTVLTMWNQLRAAASYKADKPRYPVLLLNSLGDRLVGYVCSVAIAKKWGLPIQTHEWAGHDLAHDDPIWIINQIRNWKLTMRP